MTFDHWSDTRLLALHRRVAVSRDPFFRRDPYAMIRLRTQIEARGYRQWMGGWQRA